MFTHSKYLFGDIVDLELKINRRVKFMGSDTHSEFTKNQSKMSTDWPWHTCDIDYDYNSHGYRCAEFQLDQDYALALGCSHTEGVGIRSEQTYVHHLSKSLGMPVYNLGVGGASNQLAFFNTVLWIKNHGRLCESARLPRVVFVQWTQVSRRGEILPNMYFQTGAANFPVPRLPVWSKILENTPANFELDTWYYYQTIKLLWQAMGVDQVHFMIETPSINKEYTYLLSDCDWHWINDQHQLAQDLARDRLHLGPESNKIIAKSLLDIYHGRESWIRRNE